MFIKSFVTIFFALFYSFVVLYVKITPKKGSPKVEYFLAILLTWFTQAIIGATLVVLIYHIWN